MTFDTRAPLSIQSARTINVGRGSGGSPSQPGEPGGAIPTILWDGFESADMSAPDGPAPYLNRDGFTWGSNNRTSVVTRNEDGNVAVWNNGSIYNINNDPPERDWTAKTGDYCLRFRYPPMPNGEMSEQRFDLGETIFPEIWLSFWLRVPLNFYHYGTAGERNHKLFRLWQDDYEVIEEKFGMEFRGDGDGNSNFYIWPGSGSGDALGSGGNAPFINIGTDHGRWMNLVVRGRIESNPGASDGLIEVWRKWEDETSHTKTHERLNISMQRASASGKEGFNVGYLMGWHNGGYEEETEWLIDDFKISETSLLEE